MSCGCGTGNCGCTLVPGEYISIGEGPVGTFTITGQPPVKDIADTDCIDLELSELGVLTASPILSTEPASVVLECTEDGIAAELVIDPASTADVSVSEDGLRVDIPASPDPDDGTPAGVMIFYQGLRGATGYIDADGSPVSRASFTALHDALSLLSETANRYSGSDIIDGIGNTRFVRPGMAVEADGFPPGMTVVSVDSSSQITVSDDALDSGSDTVLRVYPHGAGNGTTTFNVPNGDERIPLGYNSALGGRNLGATGGSETKTIAAGNLPSHTHPVADHNHGGSTGAAGAHNHVSDGQGLFAAGVTARSIVAPTTGTVYQVPQAAAASDTAPNHTHTIPTQTGLATGNNSTANTPMDIMPPFIVGRWMVKT